MGWQVGAWVVSKSIDVCARYSQTCSWLSWCEKDVIRCSVLHYFEDATQVTQCNICFTHCLPFSMPKVSHSISIYTTYKSPNYDPVSSTPNCTSIHFSSNAQPVVHHLPPSTLHSMISQARGARFDKWVPLSQECNC